MNKCAGPYIGLYLIVLMFVTIIFHSIEFRVAAWNVDEYVFATGGQKIQYGEMLYRDYGDNKPPLIYYTYSLIYRLSKGDFKMFLYVSKICTIIIVFLTALGVFFIGMAVVGRVEGMIAGLLYSAYTICAQSSEVLGGRTEVYATLFMVLSICFFIRKRFQPDILSLIASGFLLSLAALYNTRFGIVIIVYCIFLLYKSGINVKTCYNIVVLAISFAVLLALVPVYYYYMGVFDSYSFWQSTILKYYLHIYPLYLRLLAGLLVVYFFAGLGPLALFAILHVVHTVRQNFPFPNHQTLSDVNNSLKLSGNLLARLCLWLKNISKWNEKNESFIFLVLLLLCMFCAFFSGGIPGIRYFYMMFVPLSLLGSQGFCNVWHEATHMMQEFETNYMIKIIMISFLVIVPAYFYVIHIQTQRPSIDECIDKYKPVVDYIKTHTHVGDKIYVWYSMSPIYIYSNRLPATSMVFPQQFLLRYYYFVGDFQNETTSWDIFLEQLKKEKPALIIDDTNGFSTWREKMLLYSQKSQYVNNKAREMRGFINNNYRCVHTLEGFKVYMKI